MPNFIVYTGTEKVPFEQESNADTFAMAHLTTSYSSMCIVQNVPARTLRVWALPRRKPEVVLIGDQDQIADDLSLPRSTFSPPVSAETKESS